MRVDLHRFLYSVRLTLKRDELGWSPGYSSCPKWMLSPVLRATQVLDRPEATHVDSGGLPHSVQLCRDGRPAA